MDKYIYMAYLSFKSSIIYRSEVLLKIIHSVIVLSIQVLIWKALYSNNTADTVLSLRDMITYLILSATFGILVFDRNIIWDIGADVRNGNISVHLSRPLSYMFAKFSNVLGRMLYLAVFNVIPIFAVALVLYGFSFPQNIYQLVMTFILSINAFLIFLVLYFIIGLSAFWFMDVHGMVELMLTSSIRLLSGAVVPLWYFPDWLKKIAYLSPTRLGFDLPLSIYFGRIKGFEIFQGIFTQFLWFILLCLLNFILWKIAIRKLVIQGG
jgi:ABC-2 type transport system permease protein